MGKIGIDQSGVNQSERNALNKPVSKAWYRNFWPWAIIVLMVSCIIAVLWTVNIAIRGADDMVVDNYYKDGKFINQVLDQDVRASELKLRAMVSFNLNSDTLNISLEGDGPLPQNLRLKLLHPVEADNDKTIDLIGNGSGSYSATLNDDLQYRYLLRLLPGDNDDWRLNGEIDFARTSETVLLSQ